jgi:hypothetical protein
MADRLEKAKEFLVGKTVEEINQVHESDDYIHVETQINSVREVCVNGEPQRCTKDMRVDRANVTTENGKITEVNGFY